MLPCYGSQFNVSAVAFNADGTLLASGGRGIVHLWDTASGRHVLGVDRGEYVGELHFVDGRLAIASGEDGIHFVRDFARDIPEHATRIFR